MLKVALDPASNVVKLDSLNAIDLTIIQGIRLTGKFNNKPAYVFQILGRRAGFTSTTVFNDVVEFANATAEIPVLVGNEALELVSSSANDTSAGSGVRIVTVTYINDEGNIIQSAISTNGTTPVPAGFVADEILFMQATSVGSGLVAAGDIRLRVVTGPVECEQISTGRNGSRSARFMVPNGYTGYVTHMTEAASGNTMDTYIRGQVDRLTGLYNSIYVELESDFLPTATTKDKEMPLLSLPAGARVKVSVIAGATPSTNIADVDLTLVLLKN